MTTTMNANGRARQTLACQIDRLDNMLDGLANGINETVVTAVQEAISQAVREAVQAAVSEVLTNTALQRRLQPAPTESSDPPPKKGHRVTQTVGNACSWVARKVKGVLTKVAAAASQVCQMIKEVACFVAHGALTLVQKAYQMAKAVVSGCWRRIIRLFSLAPRVRKGALIALGVGIVAGSGCYLAGPLVASAVTGLYSAVLTLVATQLQPAWRLLTTYVHASQG
jgi:hypothetical protein